MKSADKADKLPAKIRRNVHHDLTPPEILLVCKMFLMNNFQSEKNGAEVVAASGSNPVRVATFMASAQHIRTQFEPEAAGAAGDRRSQSR
jgi:hypothetical protein